MVQLVNGIQKALPLLLFTTYLSKKSIVSAGEVDYKAFPTLY